MKVLFISLGMRSGTAQYPAQLANELSNIVDIHVLTPVNSEIRDLYNEGVQIHKIRSEKIDGYRKYLLSYLEIIKKVVEISPDLIHFPFYNNSEILLFPLSFMRYPIVATVHDPISHSGMELGFLNYDVLTHGRSFTSKFFDCIIVHGDQCRTQALEAGYRKNKIKQLPHGLYSSFMEKGKKLDNTTYDEITDLNGPTILFFGEIRYNKGYDRIPEIIDIIIDQIPDINVVIAGPIDTTDCGDVINAIEKLKDRSEVLVFDEYIPIEEVRPFFEVADVTVLPYYDATASGVLMLSYTFSNPVVTTDTGEIGEFVKSDKTGLTTSLNNSSKIAENTIKLISNPELQERFQINVEKARENYTWDSIAENTKAIYTEVLNNS